MQKYKIELLAPAWRELDAIAEMHLALVGARSAAKITDSILDALMKLGDVPLAGMKVKNKELAEQGYRMLIVGNYLCFYKFDAVTVTVFHIVDGRKNYPRLLVDMM
ncbi:MAG: type II toxin-antitoxin system RelE/ParE family toxin [Ruthenibacterium sp.]